MRPVLRLGKLRVVGSRRARFLRSLIDSYSCPVPNEYDPIVAYVTIEALNLWASFVRSHYLSCALHARRESGPRVTTGIPLIQTRLDAIGYAVHLLRPKVKGPPFTRRDEPTWHETGTLLKLFSAMNASNFSQVQTALSYQPDVFTFLPPMRNFFAHRNEETAGRVSNVARALSLNPKLKARDILCSIRPSRPQNILADWLDDLLTALTLLCQ